jgi:hypothetical protein
MTRSKPVARRNSLTMASHTAWVLGASCTGRIMACTSATASSGSASTRVSISSTSRSPLA